MIAIFKRDFRSLFTNVIGWIFVSVLCAFFGLYFLIYNLVNGYPYLSYSLSGICSILLIVTPILCMRIFTEERKNKTDQLIFTSPVSPIKIILGKYLAVALTFTIACAFIGLSPIVLEVYGASAIGQNYVALLGFYLFGLACIAIALFVSTLTKSQIISVILSFVILFVGYIADSVLGMIFTEENFISKIFDVICLAKPLQNFLNGIFDVKAIIYYALVVVIFLFFTYCVIQKRRWTLSKQALTRFLSRGAAVVVSIVIVIAVNVGVSYIPDKYLQFDATATGIYTLSDEGKDFLKNYDHEATIYVLSAQSSADENLNKTLDQFDSYKNINVEYVDMQENPMFASKYTSQTLSTNSLIVVCGDNYRTINYDDIYQYDVNQSTYSYDVTGYDGEGLIISALESVVNNNATLICTLTGHNELALGENITSGLSKGNYNVQSLNLLESETVPDNCKILVINAPSKDLSADDVTKINDYAAKGGNIIFNVANVDANTRSLVSIDDMPNYKSLLQGFGINAKKGIVCDDSNGYYYRQSYALLPEVLSSDVSTGIEGKQSVLLYSASALEYTEGGDMTYTPLLKTSDSAYIKANLDGTSGSSTDKSEGDETGSFYLGIEAKKANSGTIVVYGCQYLFEDQMDSMVYGHNTKLFTNTITAMTSEGEEVTSTVIIPTKSLKTENIMVTGAGLIIYGILWGILIPLGCIVVGIVIWAIRRKK